jgi:hypothetical protein
MDADHNPYAPPRAQVTDCKLPPRIKPREITRAMIALWVAYGLTFIHAAIVIGERWTSWPPETVVLNQLAFELLYAALIYFISSGRYWARLIYAVLLGARTVNVILYLPDDWQSIYGLPLLTAISFTCQYTAMYWLFTEPGRRWFLDSRAG